MIVFEQRRWWHSLLRLIPSVRRREDARMRAALQQLMDDPHMACMISGTIVQDGFGPT